jgi:hypothetical protein
VKTVGSLAVSGALLISFILIEARVEAPLLPLRMLRMRNVAGANSEAGRVSAMFDPLLDVGVAAGALHDRRGIL